MEDIFNLGIKALIRNKKGEILLLKTDTRQLKGYDGKAYWDIPGGRIQKDDTVEDTLKREIEEETGIKDVKNIRPFDMVLSNIRIPRESSDVGLILSIHTCEVENVIDIKLSEEHTEVKWFSPRKAAKLLEFKYPKKFTYKLKSL
jgi:8-oxo-dGTP pyrophosphatase MutT (NUDIX family)